MNHSSQALDCFMDSFWVFFFTDWVFELAVAPEEWYEVCMVGVLEYRGPHPAQLQVLRT